MNDNSQLLQDILSKLDRGGAPNAKFPDNKGEYWALCPFHQDHEPTNFSVSERGYKCFACGAKGGLRNLAKELKIPVRHEHSSLTLAEYAATKRLPIAFLLKLGLKDAYDSYGNHFVEIPYKSTSGAVRATRKRMGMSKGSPRFLWKKGSKARLYGLERLSEVKRAGWVLLVEGESDAQTAWLHQLPALGIPGATTWKRDWNKYVAGLDVYVWNEGDAGGDALLDQLRKAGLTATGLKVIASPAGVKDISEAHIAGQDVPALVTRLKETAVPLAETLPGAVNGAEKIDDLAEWTREQLAGRVSREAKAVVADALGTWFVTHDRLVVDTAQGSPGRPYVVQSDSEIWPLDKDSVPTRLLLHRAGLNGSEPTYAFVLADLQMQALEHGRTVKLAKWFAQRGRDTYVSCGPAKLVRARNGTLEKLPNGTDNVFFAGDAALPEWQPTEEVNPLELKPFSPILDAPAEAEEYTPDVQRNLLGAWLTMLVSGIRPLPMLLVLGQRGGGKSTLARAIVRVLLGDDHNLTTLGKQRDFEALVVGAPVVGLDNLDNVDVDSWLPDSLAAVVTGTNIERRQMYTDTNRIAMLVTAALVITTRTASFARPDITERSLPILTGEFPDNDRQTDTDLMATVSTKRDGILSWLASRGWLLRDTAQNAPAGLPLRFQDYAKFVWAYMEIAGQGDATVQTLKALRKAQALAIAENDPLVEAISEHIGTLVDDKWTAAKLVKHLSEQGLELPYLGGGREIARRVREGKRTLGLAGIRVLEEKRQGRSFFVFWKKAA